MKHVSTKTNLKKKKPHNHTCPSIFCTAYPTQCRGEPGAYHKGLGAQRGGQRGPGASPSQGTIAHTTDNLEIPIRLQGLSLDWWWKPVEPGGDPQSTGRTCKLPAHRAGGTEPSILEVRHERANLITKPPSEDHVLIIKSFEVDPPPPNPP